MSKKGIRISLIFLCILFLPVLFFTVNPLVNNIALDIFSAQLFYCPLPGNDTVVEK